MWTTDNPTFILIQSGKPRVKYDFKIGQPQPADFVPFESHDTATGYWPVWVQAYHGPIHQRLWEAMDDLGIPEDGMYILNMDNMNG